MNEQADFEAYEVKCARCGKVGLCTEFMIEEGDEWECPECWERCEREERAKPTTVRGKLDALIDWYERNNPDAGKVILVSAAYDTVRRFAKRAKRGAPLMYRDREVIPVGSRRKPREEARA